MQQGCEVGPAVEAFQLPDRKPYCDAPVPISVVARRNVKRFVLPVLVDRNGHQYTEVVAWRPCRKCAKCQLYRKLHWRKRMQFETDKAERTWFVTLTLSPKARAEMDRTVRPEQFVGEAAELSKARTVVLLIWLRDYLKRLRYTLGAEVNAKLRYVAVTEYHKDGYPHVHLLVHTTSDVKHAMVRKARWGRGFVDAKLCDAGAAAYLSKYLTKSNAAVRASINYGALPQDAAMRSESETEPESDGVAVERPSPRRNRRRKGKAESGDTLPAARARGEVDKAPEGLDLRSAQDAEAMLTELGDQSDGISVAKAVAAEGLPAANDNEPWSGGE